jgi:hypothetical protein
MDWIEKFLHVSPDGGSGWFEFLMAAIVPVAAGLASGVLLRRRARRGRAPM